MTSTPHGMTVVSQEEFFRRLRADKRDIMPTCSISPDYTPWLDKSNREIARTLPGWRNPGDPKVYMVSGSLGSEGSAAK